MLIEIHRGINSRTSLKRGTARKSKATASSRDSFFRFKVSDASGAPIVLDNRQFYPNTVYSLKKHEQWNLRERVSECLRDPDGPFAEDQVEIAEGFRVGNEGSRTIYVAQKSATGGLHEFHRRRGFLNRRSLSAAMERLGAVEKENARQVTFDFLRPANFRATGATLHCKLGSTQAQLGHLLGDPAVLLEDKLEIEREAKRQVALDRLEDQVAAACTTPPPEHHLFDYVVPKEAPQGQRRDRRRRRCNSKSESEAAAAALPSPKDRKVILEAPECAEGEDSNDTASGGGWMELELEEGAATDLLEMTPIRVRLPTGQILRAALKSAFGARHLEGCSEPRKFALNLAEPLARELKCGKGKPQALLIFEVVKAAGEWTTCDVLLNADMAGPRQLRLPADLDGATAANLPAFVERCVVHTAAIFGAHFHSRLAPVAYRYLRRHQPSASPPGATVATATGEWEVVEEAPEEEEEGFEVVDPTCRACTAPLAMRFEASALSERTAGSGAVRPGCCLTPCGHHFCAACWRWHLPAQIALGRAALRCPDPDCTEAVDPVTALRFISLPLYAEHAALLSLPNHGAAAADPRLVLCPQPGCTRAVRLSRPPSQGAPMNVECGARHVFCFSCREEAHWPAPCAAYQLYKAKLLAQGLFGEEDGGSEAPQTSAPTNWRSKHFGATVRWRQLRRRRSNCGVLQLNTARLTELLAGDGPEALAAAKRETSRVQRSYAELLRIVEFAHVATLCLKNAHLAGTGRELRNGAHALTGLAAGIRDCVNNCGRFLQGQRLAERSERLHNLFAQARGVLAKIHNLTALQDPGNLRKVL